MKKRNSAALKIIAPAPPLKLDLGCGKNKTAPDWVGVDARKFEGVDLVHDLTKPWPWKNDSVDEAHCSHFLEHLDATERIHFVNELYRVLKPGAQCKLVTPDANSGRAYGDLTHKWPPVVSFWFYYLSREWRAQNAPHNDFYTCNFAVGWGHSLRPDIAVRNQEYQQFALANFKEAAQDMIATLTKA